MRKKHEGWVMKCFRYFKYIRQIGMSKNKMDTTLHISFNYINSDELLHHHKKCRNNLRGGTTGIQCLKVDHQVNFPTSPH